MVLIATSLLFTLVGCPKEEKSSGGNGVVAQEGGITSETELPDDKDTRKFADHLVRNPILNFKPNDGAGADLMWQSVKFGAKNHWEAQATLSAGGETVGCEEAGRWTLDKAESADKAVLNLDTNKSTCAGRSGADQYRVAVTAEGDTYTIVFR